MDHLRKTIKPLIASGAALPFSVYSSVYEQKLKNVPVAKPVLIVVLSGKKELSDGETIKCQAGDFIFLSDSHALNMRNIPEDNEYSALLIEFEYEAFADLPVGSGHKPNFLVGDVGEELLRCLQQFVESAAWAPESLWSLRKKEILMLLYHLGHQEVVAMMGKPKVSHHIYDLVVASHFQEVTTATICDQLAMSESTLRRKLKSEGSSVQEIKDRARLGYGLHLLQTTEDTISLIAEQCGYGSQSRFTERFKSRFGLTPTQLRNTKEPIRSS